MAEEKILKDEIMDDEELDNVAGGTVGELEDLTAALIKKVPSASMHLGVDALAASHTPGLNGVLGQAVLLFLEKDMGIHAAISLGVSGTGIKSKPNIYTEISTGKSLTHKEVLDRIKNL